MCLPSHLPVRNAAQRILTVGSDVRHNGKLGGSLNIRLQECSEERCKRPLCNPEFERMEHEFRLPQLIFCQREGTYASVTVLFPTCKFVVNGK
jgi:hypothetical protein